MPREEILGIGGWIDISRCRCHRYALGYAHVSPAGFGVPAVSDEMAGVEVILDQLVVGLGMDIGADRVRSLSR